MSSDEYGSVGGEFPDPLEEGWWMAVLADETEGRGAGSLGLQTGPSSGNGAAGQEREVSYADWEMIREYYEADEPLRLDVVGHNRGGLLVALNSLRGFVPASHLVGFPAQPGEAERKAYLAGRVGDTLALKVIEYDSGRGRVVLSERAALAGPGSRRQLLDTLQPGDVVEGTVTNLTHFGVFVDLGGVEGLIHISEMSWGRVDHPGDMLACGEEVKVYVLSVDREQGRVALSLRWLQPDPWATVEDRYTVGQEVVGTITNVVDFGAFVCVEEGLEGLIHVSELAEGNFMHPRNVVSEGEVVTARILAIDGSNRRLGLSMRAVSSDALQTAAAEEFNVVP